MAYQYDDNGQVGMALNMLQTAHANHKKNLYILSALATTQMLAHRFSAACATTSKMHANGQVYAWQVLSLEAETQRACGHTAESRREETTLIKELNTALEKTPNNSLMHATLGIAYANIGNARQAIAEGRHAVALSPSNKDVFSSPDNMVNLALIYARLHKPAQATNLLKTLMQTPAGTAISLRLLKVDPNWDPIRHTPEFQSLLRKHFKIHGDAEWDQPVQ